jgi:CMP-N-acetylneuraminic acid synthetase
MGVHALALGRGGSTGFPGKNVYPVLGRPLMTYPLTAALRSKHVDRLYLSTDDDEIRRVGESLGAEYIERPPALATKEALAEDAYVHGYEEMQRRLAEVGDTVDILVLLMCNAPTITGEMIDRGVEALLADPELDSAVSVSRYNMWSPLRARRVTDDGTLQPFVPFETFGDPKTLNCDRDSQGDVWFADMGVSIIRPRCLEHLHDGLLPQKWMGQRIAPIYSDAGFDLDYEWQFPVAEWWLKNQGWAHADD